LGAGKAATFFERPLTIARKQPAKSWGLRAAMSIARLWRGQGRPNDARDQLAPIYGWFTQGFETSDFASKGLARHAGLMNASPTAKRL